LACIDKQGVEAAALGMNGRPQAHDAAADDEEIDR
jgi:hypothetical protein